MEIRSPETEQEFAAYYELRWRVLRKPWGQPSGSERDELDAAATHVAGYDEAKRLVCVRSRCAVGGLAKRCWTSSNAWPSVRV